MIEQNLQLNHSVGDPLVLNFGSQKAWESDTLPELVKGEGQAVFDAKGKRYLDCLSSLYCVNIGYGNERIADAVHEQIQVLPYAPVWGEYHPKARELAQIIGDLSTLDDARVFFTSGGSESIEAAIKMVKQYHFARGDAARTKVFSRAGAYHGTSMGALSVNGVQDMKTPFEPLLPGFLRIPSIHPRTTGLSGAAHSAEITARTRQILLDADPRTIAAVIIEPVQNSGGCLEVGPDYFEMLVELRDEHGFLLVSDETICSWGRTGDWFGSQTIGYSPDIITTAKGMTSGYIPMGCMITSGRVLAEAEHGLGKFAHGVTFGGHPVAAAAALANIAEIKDRDLLDHVRESSATGRVAKLKQSMSEWPLIVDVRGQGYFIAIEMGVVADNGQTIALSSEQIDTLYGFLPSRIKELGIIARVMNRKGAVIQFSPALTMTDAEFDELEEKLTTALTEAKNLLGLS